MIPVADPDRVAALAAELGLPWGRLIAESKSGYHAAHPAHLVIFNATVADEAGTPLWWGDLDLTLDESKLVALAVGLDATLCVLWESEVIGRELYGWPFDPLTAAVVRLTPAGEVLMGDRAGLSVGRDAAGRLVRATTVARDPGSPA